MLLIAIEPHESSRDPKYCMAGHAGQKKGTYDEPKLPSNAPPPDLLIGLCAAMPAKLRRLWACLTA
jgi:hypothetical protein